MADTAAMSTADHGTAHTVTAHDASGDAGGHGSSHGHGHEEPSEPLGPVDLVAWGYAVGGGAIGLLTALALYAAAHL